MTAQWVGVLTVGALVLLIAPVARAGGEAPGPADGRELSGTVIKSEADTLYLEHMGAVVQVEIGRETRFFGVRSANELAAGQEVRASFAVTGGTKNVAHSVSLTARSSGVSPEPATVEFTDQG